MLYKTINTSGTSQNGPNIAKEIQNVIDELGGPDRVVGVVTDNASNMQSAWEFLESDNTGLIVNGCGAHTFNLLVKDVSKLPEYAPVLQESRDISQSNPADYSY